MRAARCPACTRVARGVYPDVVTIAPGESGAITIDEVRQAVGQAVYRPFEGRRRVVVIDDADRLVPQAQNALLKTLEEPARVVAGSCSSPRGLTRCSPRCGHGASGCGSVN